MRLLFFYLTFFLVVPISHSSKIEDYSVKKLENDLATYDSKLSELKAEINSLEKKIGSKNGKYISKLEKIKSIENMMMSLDDQLIENISIIDKKKNNSKHLLEKLYINSIDEDEEGEFLYNKTMYTKILKNENKDLEQTLKRSVEFKESLNRLQSELAQIKDDEKNLYQVILNLEEEKKRIAEVYLENEEKRKMLETKIEKEEVNKKISKLKNSTKVSTEFKLSTPLDHFLDYKADKKGITYSFREVMPVKSAADGKVIYIGDIPHYGNVVMIDHGKDIKTVFLGDLDVRVKKDDQLKTGDVLGYTKKATGDKDKQLYFEVRKKNKAQNTVMWLDKNSIVKI